MRKPLLGICYGTQSLNVWRGGSLVQHIESPVQHQRPDDKPRGFVIEHAAVVEAGSRLAELTGAGEITVELQPSPVGQPGGRRPADCGALAKGRHCGSR